MKNKVRALLKSDTFKYYKYPILIGILICIMLLKTVIKIYSNLHAIFYIDSSGLSASFLLYIINIILPIPLFMWSTAYDFYNYSNRKLRIIYFMLIQSLVDSWEQLLRLLMPLIVPWILKIPISTEVTMPMVVNLARGLVLITSLTPIALIGIFIGSILEDSYNKSNILKLKVLKHIDIRRNRRFRYDFKVIRNLSSGKMYTVKEKDRTLHTFADGTTGTAKTSSVLSVAICNDLDQKVYNENYQRKICYKNLHAGLFKIQQDFTDSTFSINYIAPADPKDLVAKEQYHFLKFVSQTIGITCFAPNAAFADEIYEMAKARKISVNRVDPILTAAGDQKSDFIGFNPLYTSPLLEGISRDVDITNKATIFADVLQCLYEASGSGDAYFISLNNSVTIAICKLLMLTFEHKNGRQPNPSDVQMCINDFSLCEPYLRILVQLYGNNGNALNEIQRDEMEDRVKYDVKSNPKNVNCGVWQDIYTLIKDDLLGPNKDNMYDRSNGLRLQVNNFLNHPLIRRVLCADESIDLDRALANGEITIVNYALELGESVSTAFGLFYLLSLSKAVLRRPGTEQSRTLHMIYIDEFSCLLHRSLEVFFTLFRQYKVGNLVAFQTLDQMDKNETTKYLKGVLLGNCAHQLVFGRVSPTEMKIYETMGGQIIKPIEQHAITETSLTLDNPSYSYSTRSTEQLGNLIEGHEIRNRDFQEVTFYTVNDNSPVPPFVGKVGFLSEKKRRGHTIKGYNWKPFIQSDIITKSDELKKSIMVYHKQEQGHFKFTSYGVRCQDTYSMPLQNPNIRGFYKLKHVTDEPCTNGRRPDDIDKNRNGDMDGNE